MTKRTDIGHSSILLLGMAEHGRCILYRHCIVSVIIIIIMFNSCYHDFASYGP